MPTITESPRIPIQQTPYSTPKRTADVPDEIMFEGRPYFRQRQVAIVGMGIISPVGLDVPTAWNNITSGSADAIGIRPTYFKDSQVKVSAKVVDFDPVKESGDYYHRNDDKRVHRSAQFAVAATFQAAKDARMLDSNGQWGTHELLDPNRIGIQIGTGYGGAAHLTHIDKLLRRGGGRWLLDRKDRSLRTKNRLLGTEILKSLVERSSSVPSMSFGFRGPMETPTAACASSNYAISGAAQEIVLNNADMMIAGGTESSIKNVTVKAFDAMLAKSHSSDPYYSSRPFDVAHDGFVMAEGAGVVVLEELEHAIERGAPIYGILEGIGNTSDAGGDTAPTGVGSEEAMRKALKHGIPNEGIIYFNAHGTGTAVGDGPELEAIKRVVPEDVWNRVRIGSTKWTTGHALGAAGALETIFTLQALQTQKVPGTFNLQQVIAEAVDLHIPVVTEEAEVVVAYNNSFGFGGYNSSLGYRLPYTTELPEGYLDQFEQFAEAA